MLLFLLALHIFGPVKTLQMQHYDVTQTFGVSKNIYTGKEILQYSPTHRLMEYSVYDTHTRQLYVRNTYAPSGKIFISDTTAPSGDRIASYNYDTTGRLLRHSIFDRAGNTIAKTIFGYKDDSLPCKAIQYADDGAIHYTITWQYEYDRQQRLTAKYTHVEHHEEMFTIPWGDNKETYDTAGNNVGGSFTLSGEDNRVYLYNNHNDIIEDRIQHLTYRYTYDTLNNITERFTYQQQFGQPTLIHYTKYTYTYHPSPPKKPHTIK